MRDKDYLGAAVGELGDGRGVALDARDIGHFAVLHRNVEIDADEDALALHIGVVEGAKGHDGKL